MRAICQMDIRALPADVKNIYEEFEGTEEECYAWGLSKRDEFLDLTGWAYNFNGYLHAGGKKISDMSHPNDFIIFVLRPFKDFISVSYYDSKK